MGEKSVDPVCLQHLGVMYKVNLNWQELGGEAPINIIW